MSTRSRKMRVLFVFSYFRIWKLRCYYVSQFVYRNDLFLVQELPFTKHIMLVLVTHNSSFSSSTYWKKTMWKTTLEKLPMRNTAYSARLLASCTIWRMAHGTFVESFRLATFLIDYFKRNVYLVKTQLT